MMVGVVVSVCLADDLRSDGEKFRKRCSLYTLSDKVSLVSN